VSPRRHRRLSPPLRHTPPRRARMPQLSRHARADVLPVLRHDF
jgi:hypothetical protein